MTANVAPKVRAFVLLFWQSFFLSYLIIYGFAPFLSLTLLSLLSQFPFSLLPHSLPLLSFPVIAHLLSFALSPSLSVLPLSLFYFSSFPLTPHLSLPSILILFKFLFQDHARAPNKQVNPPWILI